MRFPRSSSRVRLSRLRFTSFFVSWSLCGPPRPASHASAASGAFWLFPFPAFVVLRSAVTRLNHLRWSSFFVFRSRRGPRRFASDAVSA